MKIVITIIVNLLIALIVFTGAMKGKRYGLKYELPKLLILLGVLTGMFFLTPIINEKVVTISLINELITRYAGFDKLIYVLILVLPVAIVYAGMSLTLRLIRKHSDRINLMGMNRARKGRVRSIDKSEERRLKRQERKDFKINRKTIKISTGSKIGGIICGVLIAIVLCSAEESTEAP